MRPPTAERSILQIISVASLVFPVLLGFLPVSSQSDQGRGVIILAVYVMICAAGVYAALFPNVCSRRLDSVSYEDAAAWKDEPRLTSPRRAQRGLLNHHSPCEGFRFHEARVLGRGFCIGCTGMVVGAVVSSLMVAAYFTRVIVFREADPWPLLAGTLLVAAGLFNSLILSTERQGPRLFLSMLFVVGGGLTLVGEDLLRRSLQADSFILGLSLLWLSIRVRSSNLSHERICSRCGVACSLQPQVRRPTPMDAD